MHSRALRLQDKGESSRCLSPWQTAHHVESHSARVRLSPPYLLNRLLATFCLLFLGDCWIPVTHQAVILDTVVLVTKKPVGFHFPFALGQEKERTEKYCFHGIGSRAENQYSQGYYLYCISSLCSLR